MSANTFLIDAQTRRAIFLQRFAEGEANKAVEMLDDLKQFVSRKLLQDPNGFQAERFSVVLQDIEQTARALYLDIGNSEIERLEEFAPDQAGFTLELLERASTNNIMFQLPTDDQLIQAVTGGDMMVKLGEADITVETAVNEFAGAKTDELMRTINTGILTGETNEEINKSAISLIDNRQARHTRTLVRTMTNHAANQVNQSVYKRNQALLGGYEWVSVLDHRTSLLCAGRDGRVYKIGKGPVPPAHFNCRSTTIPTLVEDYQRKNIGGERESETGEEPGNITYGQWLKRQTDTFQEEVLGEERAKLFRQGAFTIDRFRDETGKVYTLKELREMNPEAFGDTTLV